MTTPFFKPKPGPVRLRFLEPAPLFHRHWVKLPPSSAVCADCGNEQGSMDRCKRCGSVRVVTQKMIESVYGPDWREAFRAEPP